MHTENIEKTLKHRIKFHKPLKKHSSFVGYLSLTESKTMWDVTWNMA